MIDRMYFHKPISILFFGFWICGAIVESENDILDSYKGCRVSFGDGNEKDGLCINLEQEIIRCPSLKTMLLDKNFTEIYATTCGEPDVEKLNETQICCPVEEYIEPYSTISESFASHKNFRLIPTPETSKCGEAIGSYTDRIIGGTAAPPGSQPWMVRLGLVLSEEDAKTRFLCSGSILNERYIISAAHCLKHGILRTIRLAEYDEDVEEECIETISGGICQRIEDYTPEDILIHENYTGQIGSRNDIALIRLKEPIRNITSLFTRPICLPFIDEFELPDLENVAVSSTGIKNALSVQGWGKENNEDHDGAKQLKQVNVPLRSNVYCRHFFRKANLTVTDQQICVGGAKDKGSCAGDSGSPLLLSSHSLKKQMGMRMFQVGIVSYGRQRCGVKDSPVVYTRVRSFLKWILDNIQE